MMMVIVMMVMMVVRFSKAPQQGLVHLVSL